jgi:hypothetical protein
VPDVKPFTVRGSDGERGHLVLEEAKGLGDVEILEPRHLNCVQVNSVRLDSRRCQKSQQCRIQCDRKYYRRGDILKNGNKVATYGHDK